MLRRALLWSRGPSPRSASLSSFTSPSTRHFEAQALQSLKEAAYSHPSSPTTLSRYLRELGKTYPAEVVDIVEKGRFGVDESVLAEYIKALVRVGSLNPPRVEALYRVWQSGVSPSSASSTHSSLSTHGVYRTVEAGSGRGGGGGGLTSLTAGQAPLLGSPALPVTLKVVEASNTIEFGRFLRHAAITYVFVSFVVGLQSELAEGSSIQRDLAVTSPDMSAKNITVRFSDVKGADSVKEELEEIVQFLKKPKDFTRLGGKLPKGVLLSGPPGTGKTLLARAVAGEAGVPFFHMSGSEFDELLVGVGAKRVRELFAKAKAAAPAIIFIDEIDAVGSSRSRQGQAVMSMTLNQLLVELDGFGTSDSVVVIAATNFAEALDPALVRPGRFDRRVSVPLPDLKGRMEILKYYVAQIVADPALDLHLLARSTIGLSGAELSNLVNEAALHATREKRPAVIWDDFVYAHDKTRMGAEQKTLLMTDEMRTQIAYHEGGHALVSALTPGHMPIYKATLLARGQTLGHVEYVPEDDMPVVSKAQLMGQMASAMAGRVSEELIFGRDKTTSGASGDFKAATRYARDMVTHYGMSEAVGLMSVGENEELSPWLSDLVDAEVKRLVEGAYEEALRILKSHEAELHALARALLDYETLSGEEVYAIARGEHLAREPPLLHQVDQARV